jgi:L-glyceraldehyde 3-phosphate reductase
VAQLKALDAIARERGQSLAQLALAWLLKDQRLTSVLIGASSPKQIADCVGCLANLRFDAAELAAIEHVIGDGA